MLDIGLNWLLDCQCIYILFQSRLLARVQVTMASCSATKVSARQVSSCSNRSAPLLESSGLFKALRTNCTRILHAFAEKCEKYPMVEFLVVMRSSKAQGPGLETDLNQRRRRDLANQKAVGCSAKLHHRIIWTKNLSI